MSTIALPTTTPSEKTDIFFAVFLSLIPNPTTTGILEDFLMLSTLSFKALKESISAPVIPFRDT